MFYYKISNDKYVAESDTPRDGWYESAERIDCTLYAPDTEGNPVLIPAPVVPDPPATYVPTLAEAQSQRKEYIKTRRNTEESKSPFEFDGSLFDYDSLSRERINSAVLGSTIAVVSGVAPNTVVAEWRLFDNTVRPMMVSDWLGFKSAEITRSSDCFATAASLKGAIDAASDVQTVWGIDWPSVLVYNDTFTGNWSTGNWSGNDSFSWNNP